MARRPTNRPECFAVCAPGLEALLAAELTGMGISPRPEKGGVAFRATQRQIYATNAHLRTATRVLVRIAQFRAASFADLERAAQSVSWAEWLPPGTRPSFRVSATKSRLHHTDAIAERLLRASDERSLETDRATAGDDGSSQLFVVRAVRDRFTLSVDSSGAPLHERGYRLEPAKAPIRETLAAAMLLATGWTGSLALADPFCGSGTIVVEAALLAAGRAPGRSRDFAFMGWPGFEPGTWASVRAGLDGEPDACQVPIVASDRDAGAVEITARNAARAGVEELVSVERRSISEFRAPAAHGWVISNPPYGRRIRGGDLRNLYARLGAVARSQAPGWSVGLLVDDGRLAAHTGLRLRQRFKTRSGGRAVTFFTGAASPSSRNESRAVQASDTPDPSPDSGNNNSGH